MSYSTIIPLYCKGFCFCLQMFFKMNKFGVTFPIIRGNVINFKVFYLIP